MNVLKWILHLTWELPQTLVGAILWLVTSREKRSLLPTYKGTQAFYFWNLQGSISLGPFRILSVRADKNTWSHEYGHSLQSMILGPLYLLIIGLPSILWAAFICDWSGKSYYWFYTELWADSLGGVKR